MPELPEVETVKNVLKRKIVGKVIKKVDIYYEKIIEFPSIIEFKKQIENEKIINVNRKGKWIMIELTNFFLLSHLRMEGKYLYKNKTLPKEKHEHVIFTFIDDTDLRYQDTRKFGKMHLIKKDEVYSRKPLNELGLEPFDENLNSIYLKEKYKNKNLPIKTSLLDQSIITGIGNIYADEILFKSRINPYKVSKKCTKNNLEDIIKNTKEIMEEAIKKGGTTIKSYESEKGVHGTFQDYLQVHGKDICPICKEKLKKEFIGGRSTYYCNKCQK